MQGQGQGPSLQGPGQGQGLDLQRQGQGLDLQGQGLDSQGPDKDKDFTYSCLLQVAVKNLQSLSSNNNEHKVKVPNI